MNSIVNSILARLTAEVVHTFKGTVSQETVTALAVDLGLIERKRKVGTLATLAGCEYVGADMREVVEATREAREAAKIDAQIAKLTAKKAELTAAQTAQA